MSKAAKSDESQVADIVFAYLRDSSRPYSVNDIHNNLQKEFGLGKPAVQRALDGMVADGTLREKVYGKQKIYFADQSKCTPVSSQTLLQLDEELAAVTTEWQQLSDEVRAMESQASGLSKVKSVDELRRECRELEKECQELEQKLQTLKQGSRGVDPAENRKVKDKLVRLVTEWRKRKRLASNSLDAILEACPKPKKALMEEMGLDTDEEFNAVLPKL